MATQHRQQPTRLFIPPMLNSQLANSVDTRTMFSPALQTAHQSGFPPLPSAHPFNPGFPLQTPIQTSFFHPQSNMPPRQMVRGHRATGSIAQIPNVGMHPPVPMTPFGSQFPPQMMLGGVPPNPSAQQPFVPKSRRTPSVIGGPPKAALGGPNRKVSPLPPSSQAVAIAEKVKAKKIPVKIPVESDVQGENVDGTKKSLWSRRPIPSSELEIPMDLPPPEVSSAALFPDEELRKHLPPTVDVFLPSKCAWDDMKQREIDEKLERLGIERRSDADVFSQRGRAASISSPADPALLMFKLNKLHKQQSAGNSISTSPQPHSASPTSPNPMLLQRSQAHGHSMSFAQPATLAHPISNGFVENYISETSNATVRDNMAQSSSPLGIYAPQGRIPAQLSVPSAPSRTESRPDFIRGFGLDIPEEEEEEAEELQTVGGQEVVVEQSVDTTVTEAPQSDLPALDVDAAQPSNVDVNVVAPKEGSHTRHASRISVALSVGSMSKNLDEAMMDHSRQSSTAVQIHDVGRNLEAIVDPLNEWTGTESPGDLSDDQESIGEWSNPSDEERARQERLQRRYLRRMRREAQEAPRRLPEFPRPPEASYVPQNDDDDIISNPSDEEGPLAFHGHAMNGQQFVQPLADANGQAYRPLPPVPHSRDPSTHYSYYGSLPSHSRGPSDHFTGGQLSVPGSRPDSTHHARAPSTSSGKKELNPFAKPFVFGSRPGLLSIAPSSVPASVQSEAGSSPAQANAPTHSRTPSTGVTRMLNAAAQEFKPGGFTFRPPDGVPKLSFPELAPESARPLPEPPIVGITRAVQGREKRQRTSISDVSYDSEIEDEEAGYDSMASFRFPAAPEPTMVFARSAPTSPSPAVDRSAATLDASAKPFTFSGFSNLPPSLPPLLGQEQRSLTDVVSTADLVSVNATRGFALGDDSRSPELTLPNMQKQKRAPIPLDFKHPISTNMVPAGLFKNLATGDADSNRAVHTQNGSLDISDARSDVSLDDLSMPAIARQSNRRVARPEDLDVTQDDFDGASSDVDSHGGRTSEETQPNSPESQNSMMPAEGTGYSQGLRLADRLETLLDHKLNLLRNDLQSQLRGGNFVSNSTEELIKEAMAMFRTQLRESAARGLENSSMDAGGELDFEMIKGIIEQGQEDIRRHIQDDLATIVKNIKDSEGSAAPESILDLIRNMQDLRANVLASSAHVSERLDAIESDSPFTGVQLDREGLILDIISALMPHLAAIRSESIDYEGLTAQLSQAVKPHISQLIDLASDKRETAGLIADQLMPILQSIVVTPTEIDTSNLVSEISATVNRIIAPVDTHVIKEQVADLVVERLDSRLATRDNDSAVRFDSLREKIVEIVSPLLEHVGSVSSGVDAIRSEQSTLANIARESSLKQVDSLLNLAALSEKVGGVAETLTRIKSLVSQDHGLDTRSQLDRIENALKSVNGSGEGFSKDEREEVLSISRELLAGLRPISVSLSPLSTLEAKQAEVLSHLQSMNETSQEVRKLTSQNVELQQQLGRARSQHGQIRVQNDDLVVKVASVEAERDQLRAKVEELQAAALAKAAEFASLEARNSEQERAMHVALDRLKVSDVNTQTYQERISELEKANRDLSRENQQLKLKVGRLEMQAEFAAQDKESTAHTLKLLQEDRDRLVAQQSHWEEFRDTAEQIETLKNLVLKVESDEMAELKHIRDQSKILEGEHAALKKRFKEQESKIANAERTSATARQNLAQAQQRASEWERKAREFEGEVERLTTALDQGEQTKNQLDADCSLAKLQLEEKDAESRIGKDRERKLEEQIASLRTKISSLTSELERQRTSARVAPREWQGSQERPSSRASTAYDAAEPPTPRLNGKTLPNAARNSSASPIPVTSTWDSMHAPRNMRTGYGIPPSHLSQRSSLYNSRAPSPTPSNVSVVTQREDGWYS